MAENLNVVPFLNGDSVSEAKSPEEWKNAGLAGKPVWCYYDNEIANGSRFGKLFFLKL
jgi:hypothetical protein